MWNVSHVIKNLKFILIDLEIISILVSSHCWVYMSISISNPVHVFSKVKSLWLKFTVFGALWAAPPPCIYKSGGRPFCTPSSLKRCRWGELRQMPWPSFPPLSAQTTEPFLHKLPSVGQQCGRKTSHPVGNTSAFFNGGVFSLPPPFFQLGMIRTKDADYFLKPLPPHLTGKPSGSAQAGSPSHVLYKRSTEPQALRENEVLLVTRQRDLARSPLHHGNSHLGLPQKQHFCGRRKKCT